MENQVPPQVTAQFESSAGNVHIVNYGQLVFLEPEHYLATVVMVAVPGRPREAGHGKLVYLSWLAEYTDAQKGALLMAVNPLIYAFSTKDNRIYNIDTGTYRDEESQHATESLTLRYARLLEERAYDLVDRSDLS